MSGDADIGRRGQWAMDMEIEHDASRQAVERQVASYLRLGWSVVERHDNPPRVRLEYRLGRHSSRPRPTTVRDNGDRAIWVDDAGEVRVKRAEEARASGREG